MLLGRNWIKYDIRVEEFGIWKVGNDDQRLVKDTRGV